MIKTENLDHLCAEIEEFHPAYFLAELQQWRKEIIAETNSQPPPLKKARLEAQILAIDTVEDIFFDSIDWM